MVQSTRAHGASQLSKPPAGSLPVFSAHSLASNRQFAHLESVEEREKSPHNNWPDDQLDFGATCICLGHNTNQATGYDT